MDKLMEEVVLSENSFSLPNVQKLSPESKLQLVTRDLASLQNEGLLSDEYLRFLEDNVDIYKVGNVDVALISQEHTEFKEDLGPVQQAFITSPRTSAVFLEYFPEELARVAQETVAVGGPLKKWFNHNWRQINEMRYADKIANLCQSFKKRIATADIAHSPSYFVAWAYGQLFTGGIGLMQELTGTGMFGSNRHSYENAMIHFEDARRLFAAKGILQLAHELQPLEIQEGRMDKHPLIVAQYPRAHMNRIGHYLSNKGVSKDVSAVKAGIYKILGPGVHFNLRLWEWKDMLARASGKPDLASWQNVSNEPIKI